MTRLLVFLLLSLPLVGAYAIFSLGLVVIYRASKVLNLAHGAMAMIPAYLVFTMTEIGIPMALAFPLGVLSGGVMGVAVERVFVRPLRSVSPTAQTVGTVAALGLTVSLAGKIWGTGGRTAPAVFPEGQISIADSAIRYGEIGLFVVMILVAGGLYLLLQRTGLGLAMRGAADNPKAASLMGVDPDLATSGAWALGGATAAIAGILLAAVTTLHAVVLALQALPALVAALIGGLGSLPGAVIGAGIVGATQGMVPAISALQKIEGSPQLLLALLAFGVMAARGERYVATDVRTSVPDASRSATNGRSKNGRRWAFIGVIAVLLFPWMPFVSFSILGSANLAAIYALVAVSLVVLTGWVGQISLGHAGLVGVGAYVTGHVVSGWGVTFPINLAWAAVAGAAVAIVLGTVAVRVRGLYLAVATLIFSWAAVEFLFRQEWFIRNSSVKIAAFGESGTFPHFEWISRRTFFYAAWAIVAAAIFMMANLRDSKTGRAFFAVRGSEVAAASLGINVVRTKLIAFAVSGALAGMSGNLLLVKDQVITQDAFRVEVSLFFLAIAVVGGLSSLPGAVAGGVLFAALNELFFRLEFLSGWLEVVPPLLLTAALLLYRGGLAAIPAALTARFGPHARRVADRVGTVVQPMLTKAKQSWSRLLERRAVAGGRSRFASAAARLKARASKLPGPLAGWVERAFPEERDEESERLDIDSVLALLTAPESHAPTAPAAEITTVEAANLEVSVELVANGVNGNGATMRGWRELQLTRPPLHPVREERRPLVEATGVTVRFGGLVAVNDVSLAIREHEIVGLIGPNGAGKTTTFNAIAGLNVPAEGTIQIYGKDVTNWTVDERARLGVGRTFQAIQLLPQLTVFENLMVATHVHNTSGFVSNLLAGQATVEAERHGRVQVRQIAKLLEIGPFLDRTVADLPFGILRMVELARALVTRSRIIMLDEPASGLDNVETERLTEFLRFVRDLGVTILLIEHDVKMVTSVSDYMYVLDRGRLLAEGTPSIIQRDPQVIAAYLGEALEDETVDEVLDHESVGV
jgi:ABC-type branched-subunit amino acid transport system ATPase component/ABC-type branched-subunit amino acid transport system permease subunit